MQSTRLFDRSKKILKGLRLMSLARETGFRQRDSGKISPTTWFWSLVLSCLGDSKRSQAEAARFASLLSGKPITRQALHDRFSRGSVEFLRRTYERLHRMAAALPRRALPGGLAAFEDVKLVDSSSIQLADRLAAIFPECRTNVRKAALKLHSQMSLKDREVERLRVTAERVHDSKEPMVAEWIRGRLVIFDLGYFAYALFARIEDWGGQFLSRLKVSANGRIERVRHGCGRDMIGMPLNDACYSGNIVDVDVAFKCDPGSRTFRVVGVWNSTTFDYHWYITSLSATDWSAQNLADIYTIRWQIELLFKDWKSFCGLRNLASGKEEVALSFIYATLCASLLIRVNLWFASARYKIDWYKLCSTIAFSIHAFYKLQLGRALVRRKRGALLHVLDDLWETLAVHARLPNGTNATLIIGDTIA